MQQPTTARKEEEVVVHRQRDVAEQRGHTQSKKMRHPPVFLSTTTAAKGAVTDIFNMHLETNDAAGDFAIAVDIEGSGIGPKSGRISIVTVALPNGRVLLFDVATAGDGIFSHGLLKELLEHKGILKLMFDCRADTAALFHHGVRPENVLDLQVSANALFGGDARRRGKPFHFLMGLAKSLEKLHLPVDAVIKSAGARLFAPEHGGSYDVFFKRPLSEVLLQYCAEDVKHLFAMRKLLANFEEKAKLVAETRIQRFSKDGFVRDKDIMAPVDFPL